jgi:hypothetical protein|tara:strand:+ start:1810 stop:2877 length:1068 start_codon:yes stop_codon:yes gene_type:complete
MQIDFHHGVTYVIARCAGFSHRDANVVAYASQYVDDATSAGTIRFDTGAMYTRIASAHKMLDYRNSKTLKNSQVWVPFHFLPGNGGKEAGQNPSGSFINKLVCKPDSYVSHDVVAACIADKHKKYGLHRLGVTMHVYADTFAHQQFAGKNHKINTVTDIYVNGRKDRDWSDRIANFFVDRALPLGHGPALSYPDRPYLKWSYKNHRGKRITRDNTAIFVEAAESLCKAMQRFRAGDADFDAPGFADQADEKSKIRTLLTETREESGEERHKAWLSQIEAGYFGFGPQRVTYVPKGRGSWKHKALKTLDPTDDDDEKFIWSDAFLDSHWKRFHDGLQAHRFDVLHDILPRYGIQVA